MLETLQIGFITGCDTSTNLLQLIETADNCQLKELKLEKSDYDKLPLDIQEFYKHLLKTSHFLKFL